MAMDRVQRTLKGVDLAAGPGLEIGACFAPLLDKALFDKDGAALRYVDHLPTEALRAKYAGPQFLGEVPVDQIREVDVVWAEGRRLADCLSPPNPVRWVVASHVVEHAPDLAGWLKQIEDVLVVGGTLSLVVPDKRFTFDVTRAESTFGDILEAHLTEARHPRLKNVYDYFAEALRVEVGDLSRLPLDPATLTPYYSIEEAVAQTRRLAAQPSYVDIHNLVVTPERFREIFALMRRFKMTGFEIASFQDTPPGDIEFFVTLVKTSDR
jgi:hypothetical protein